MTLMFSDGKFNGDISKWDVSRVTEMESMFSGATEFTGDISKWDVSSATDMTNAFSNAKLFNADISKWDVSRVTNMDRMFARASSFKQKLRGAAWVHSKATKEHMFEDSSGSVLSIFSPRSRKELQKAVETCINLSQITAKSSRGCLA